ncbi:pyridoxamine kinase [Lactobacillus ultunensis]|nr:pyridoxamine kinase [Lactobacillus ultunensis]KRL82163.1 pyridoxal kinase [Lactobacillus ultunensis DSM 16047]QQP29615.1 pyridoxamine kinase [Lactobacillus ultunensis]
MINGGVLISQDLSCAGQVSMSVALPILGACGLQPSVLPTAILSTHTGFTKNSFCDMSAEMPKIIEHWKKESFYFDALYLGYLGNHALDFWLKNIDQISYQREKVLIDPAMADNGKMYRGLNKDYVIKMRKLISKATILTPNMTEAALFLGEKITEVSLSSAKYLAEALANRFSIPNVIITGIPLEQEKIAEVGVTRQKSWSLVQKKLPGSFFGTGDIFASSFLAAYLHNNELKQSCSIAANFVAKAINATTNQNARLGPNYAAGLSWLINQLKE